MRRIVDGPLAAKHLSDFHEKQKHVANVNYKM